MLPAGGKIAYFEENGGFNIVKVVMGNPLLLALGVGVLLTVGSTLPFIGTAS